MHLHLYHEIVFENKTLKFGQNLLFFLFGKNSLYSQHVSETKFFEFSMSIKSVFRFQDLKLRLFNKTLYLKTQIRLWLGQTWLKRR